jgi:hypothetical protein
MEAKFGGGGMVISPCAAGHFPISSASLAASARSRCVVEIRNQPNGVRRPTGHPVVFGNPATACLGTFIVWF